MRGEHQLFIFGESILAGIIPACAGSTILENIGHGYPQGSSPHARGAPELAIDTFGADVDHPRMRGEHELSLLVTVCFFGIIPACAGSTRRLGSEMSCVRGSSPHARGAPAAGVRSTHSLRIIPACAGSTAARACEGDHPRMRGEHKWAGFGRSERRGIIPACAGSTHPCAAVWAVFRGSSPHARGARAPCSPPAS